MGDTQKQDLLAEIIHSLAHAPSAWNWSDRDRNLTIRHASGLELWVSMGAYAYNPKIRFGWWGERKLRRAGKRWRRVQGNVASRAADAENVDRALRMMRGARA